MKNPTEKTNTETVWTLFLRGDSKATIAVVATTFCHDPETKDLVGRGEGGETICVFNPTDFIGFSKGDLRFRSIEG